MRYLFVRAEKAFYPVTVLCRVLQVSKSGFYAWLRRTPSARQQRDQRLKLEIKAAHQRSRGTYGTPRVHQQLRQDGIGIGRKRVARLMREVGLQGLPKRRFKRTTDSKHTEAVAPNLLARDFAPDAADRAWAADVTYIRTWEGWLYLAVVLDLFSRRIVGWALGVSLERQLVIEALNMALSCRQPKPGLVSHSDRGSQYASSDYQGRLRERGIICSMSRRGDCWDNAVVESFFGTLKAELLHPRAWPTHATVRAALVDYLAFYNGQRLHSTLNYRSPVQHEAMAHRLLSVAT